MKTPDPSGDLIPGLAGRDRRISEFKASLIYKESSKGTSVGEVGKKRDVKEIHRIFLAYNILHV